MQTDQRLALKKNQLTNQQSSEGVTNDGVLYRCKTFVGRLNHFCEQNTLLELENRALRNINWDVLTITGLLS
jgi:hypothetical protein